jgi:periplasmic divalent cation tolerance protein
MQVVTLYTTWPDEASAKDCARALLTARLAACANIAPGLTSLFVWDGRVEEATEVAMIVKTSAQAAPAAEALIRDRHPYDVACITAHPVEALGSNPAFLAWVVASAGMHAES